MNESGSSVASYSDMLQNMWTVSLPDTKTKVRCATIGIYLQNNVSWLHDLHSFTISA